ncbi:MAG: DUF4124 domain-containing protein [Massilia sp.]
MKTVIFAMFCLAALGDAGATMYKSVGPDGKVTFSDRPPATPAQQLSVMGSGGFKPVDPSLAPVAGTPTAANPADVMALSKVEAKARAAARPKYASTTPERGTGPSKELASALSKAMGFTALARQTRELCTKTLPTSFTRYQSSFDRWERQHLSVLADVDRVLAAMPASGRSEVEHGVDAKIAAMMAQVVNAPMGSRIKWCDKSFEELDTGSLNFASRADIAGPLKDFDRK